MKKIFRKKKEADSSEAAAVTTVTKKKVRDKKFGQQDPEVAANSNNDRQGVDSTSENAGCKIPKVAKTPEKPSDLPEKASERSEKVKSLPTSGQKVPSSKISVAQKQQKVDSSKNLPSNTQMKATPVEKPLSRTLPDKLPASQSQLGREEPVGQISSKPLASDKNLARSIFDPLPSPRKEVLLAVDNDRAAGDQGGDKDEAQEGKSQTSTSVTNTTSQANTAKVPGELQRIGEKQGEVTVAVQDEVTKATEETNTRPDADTRTEPDVDDDSNVDIVDVSAEASSDSEPELVVDETAPDKEVAGAGRTNDGEVNVGYDAENQSSSSECEGESLRLVLTDSAVSSVRSSVLKRSFDDDDAEVDAPPPDPRVPANGESSAPELTIGKRADPVAEVYHHHRYAGILPPPLPSRDSFLNTPVYYSSSSDNFLQTPVHPFHFTEEEIEQELRNNFKTPLTAPLKETQTKDRLLNGVVRTR